MMSFLGKFVTLANTTVEQFWYYSEIKDNRALKHKYRYNSALKTITILSKLVTVACRLCNCVDIMCV